MSLMKDRRAQIAILAVLGLAVLVALAALSEGGPPPDGQNFSPSGTGVLHRWLEASGFEIQRLTDRTHLDDLDALFVLGTVTPYSRNEAEAVRRWVERGNLLVVAGEGRFLNDLLERFDVSLSEPVAHSGDAAQTGPTLTAWPQQPIQAGQVSGIESDRRDLTVHLTTEGVSVLASLEEAEGIVWVSGTVRPFTNRGLEERSNAQLVVNLLAQLPLRARIGFDDTLETLVDEEPEAESQSIGGLIPQPLLAWLAETAPGWGVLSACGLTLLYLGLRGRRFGRAVPLQEERLRRESVEYVRAMANLLRRSGQRGFVLRHYYTHFRRELLTRHGLDPRVSDDQLAEIVASRDAAVNAQELRGLLAKLSREQVTEHELIATVMQLDNWIRMQN